MNLPQAPPKKAPAKAPENCEKQGVGALVRWRCRILLYSTACTLFLVLLLMPLASVGVPLVRHAHSMQACTRANMYLTCFVEMPFHQMQRIRVCMYSHQSRPFGNNYIRYLRHAVWAMSETIDGAHSLCRLAYVYVQALFPQRKATMYVGRL